MAGWLSCCCQLSMYRFVSTDEAGPSTLRCSSSLSIVKGIGGYTWPGIRSESCTDGPLVTTALGDVTMAVLVAILAPVAAYRFWTTAVLGVVVEFSDSSCAITVTSPLLSSGIVSPTLFSFLRVKIFLK